jgi:hypothetical protein
MSALPPEGLAAPEEPRAKPAARARPPANLRGTQIPFSPPVAAPKALPPSLAPTASGAAIARPTLPGAPPVASAKPDESQCRTACAHTYYFCPSAAGSTDCSDTWSQCLGRCGHPPASIDR